MRGILAQAVKEWRQFGRDRLALAISILLPSIGLLLFGFALSMDPDNIRMVVDDLDNSPLSRQYVEAWAATNDVVFVHSRAGLPATHALDAGSAHLVLRIPPQFARDMLQGTQTRVQVLIDGTDANIATILRNVAAAVNQAFVQGIQSIGSRTAPVNVDVRFWYNPGLSDRLFFGSGALALVLVLCPALLGALSTAREHEHGTIMQVYASAFPAHEWVLGKLVAYAAIGLGELFICFVIGALVFDYRLPPQPVGFFLASLLYISCAVLYGTAVGGLLGNQSAAIQAVQLGAFLLSMLMSGFLVPVANIPVGLRWIAYMLPATYYVAIVRDSLFRTGSWATLAWPTACLGLIMGLLLTINVCHMRRIRLHR